MLNTCRSGAVGRASAVVTCLLLLSSCANDTAPSDEASYRVEFSDPAVPIEVALKEAPAAVSGTLTEFLIVDPIMSDPAAAGRRIAVLEIDEVLRGDLAAGESHTGSGTAPSCGTTPCRLAHRTPLSYPTSERK
jgi:hypothetical protein